MRGLPFLLLPLLALGACQSAHWEKPYATAESTQADITDCQRQAQREAFYQSWRVSPLFFYPSPYRPGSAAYHQWRWHYQQRVENDRFFREQQLARFCMRNKGYQLVPDEAEKL